RLDRGQAVAGGELFPRVHHLGVGGAAGKGPVADGGHVLAALPDVHRDRDDLGPGLLGDPADGDRGVQAARIGEYHAVGHVMFLIVLGWVSLPGAVAGGPPRPAGGPARPRLVAPRRSSVPPAAAARRPPRPRRRGPGWSPGRCRRPRPCRGWRAIRRGRGGVRAVSGRRPGGAARPGWRGPRRWPAVRGDT